MKVWLFFGVAGLMAEGIRYTWTPKVCRIIAFYGYWVIILPTFGGLGMVLFS